MPHRRGPPIETAQPSATQLVGWTQCVNRRPHLAGFPKGNLQVCIPHWPCLTRRPHDAAQDVTHDVPTALSGVICGADRPLGFDSTERAEPARRGLRADDRDGRMTGTGG